MGAFVMKTFLFFALLQCLVVSIQGHQNRTTHHARRATNNVYFKNQRTPAYRYFQPVSIKYHKTSYPRNEDKGDYDMTSYDTEYGGVVSNFTSSIYDDNPPLYPNPEVITRNNKVLPNVEQALDVPEANLPEETLADGDLKEHNIIDSVSYLYGFSKCHENRNVWVILIHIAGFIAITMVTATMFWLLLSDRAKVFRETSKLFPLVLNLLCCLLVCTVFYTKAIVGVSSPFTCEKIALLTHYTYLACATWIVLIAASVTDYTSDNNGMPLKFHYLSAYGLPAVVVMFNYALSMEHYEIKHYCWMSIEKGMVLGFMVPAMVLILINTGIVMIGLQRVNKKQAELLSARIHDLVEGTRFVDKNLSLDNLEVYSPGSSRKNTDSSDTLDKEYGYSEDECHYVNVNEQRDYGQEHQYSKANFDKTLLNKFYEENLSWKSNANCNTQKLKNYLNLCLVLEPFFAVNWVMGVLAVENSTSWPTPALYMILLHAMYIYLTVTLCTTFPIIRDFEPEITCEEIVAEPTIPRTRTADNIPLLDPSVQIAKTTPAPVDTISTISI